MRHFRSTSPARLPAGSRPTAIVPATHYGRSDAILERAQALNADLVILNTEVGGQKAKAKLAEKIVARHDKMAVLIARSTA